MKKLTIICAVFLTAMFLCRPAYAPVATSKVIIQEEDGSDRGRLRELSVTNDHLTKSSPGKYSLDVGTGTATDTSTSTTNFDKNLSSADTTVQLALDTLDDNVAGILTANVSYYVSPTGSDTNDGLSSGAPFATIQHAIDQLPEHLGGYIVQIELADGTYNEGGILLKGISNGDVQIYGGSYDQDAVLIQASVTDDYVFKIQKFSGRLWLGFVSLQVQENNAECFDVRECFEVEFTDSDVGDTGQTGTSGVQVVSSYVLINSVTDIDANKVATGVKVSDGGILALLPSQSSFGDTYLSQTNAGLVLAGTPLINQDVQTTGSPTFDDLTLTGDLTQYDTNPWHAFEDTDTNTGYMLHWESGDTYPFGLWPVNFSSHAPSVAGTPIWWTDASQNFIVTGAGASNTSAFTVYRAGNIGIKTDVGIGTVSPTQQLELTESLEFPTTTTSTTGVIYKGADRFIHNYEDGPTDGENTFVGLGAGNFTMGGTGTEASFNTALGFQTLMALTTGGYNTAVGESALWANTAGTRNSAFGVESLGLNTIGSSNMAIGLQSLGWNQEGDYNTAVGSGAGRGTSLMSVDNNVFIGNEAGFIVATGADNNIIIGWHAGDNITTGSNNLIIGYDIDASAANVTDEINIGGVYKGDSAKTSATIVLGTDAGDDLIVGNNNTLVVEGDNEFVGIGTASPQAPLSIAGQITLLGQGRDTTSNDVNLIFGDYPGGNFEQLLWVSSRSQFYFTDELVVVGGNLGVEVNDPAEPLHVVGTARFDVTTGAELYMIRNAAATIGGVLGGIGFDSTDGGVPAALDESSAAIISYAGETFQTTDKSAYLSFYTSPINKDAGVAATERMRIGTEGYFNIYGDVQVDGVINGPVGWWTMDDDAASTAVIDSTANGNDGVASANTNTISTNGKIAKALSFDGASIITITDAAEISFATATEDFSISIWFKRTTTGAEYLVDKRQGNNDGYRILFGGADAITASIDTADPTTATAITDTDWHHFAVTFDRDGDGQTYLDGVADGTAVDISGMAEISAAVDLILGRESYQSTNYFTGDMDDFRLYQHVLTPTEIAHLYRDGSIIHGGTITNNLIVDGDVGIGTTTPTAGLQMGDDKLIAVDVNAGLTASTTQSQGQGALTAQVNEISTVANDGDTITLPTAVAGLEIEIINNGAKTLQIFPASGDNLGTGVDAATELEANESVQYVAYDTTNWAKESTTEIIHAEMFDFNNADAYTVSVASEAYMYHTNGMQAGDLANWTFDAGGAGTSFPIASIANSPGSPGDQAQITTTGSHGLAAGDIVSLTGMSAGTNTGTFIVINPNASTFEITSGDSTNATGTMDQAAVLIAGTGSAGQYLMNWCASAAATGANDVFDFAIHVGATHIDSTNIRRKFGGAGDVGAMSGVSIITIADGDRVSFMITNTSVGAGNITMRDFTLVLVRL